MDAARHWASRPARSTEITDDRAADPQEWQAAIEAHEESISDENDDTNELFPVWPENWDAVRVFVRLRNCWRFDRFAGVCDGLDRAAIESTLRLMRIRSRKHQVIFEQLMTMESAALPILNRK